MMMKKNFSGRIRTLARIAAVAGACGLTACASDDAAPADAASGTPGADAAAAPAPPPAASTSVFNAGAPAPRFAVPPAAGQGPPSVNTVPETAPTPRSTEDEREEARKGLIADLANARHSDVGGRTQPVVVRPYIAAAAGDQAAPPAAAGAEPPLPGTDRLDEPPPPRPAEADGAPAKPAAGPAPANRIPTGSK